MLKWFLKKINNRKGFTLIELIVVIAILGILAAIAVPRLTSQTAKAREVATEATVRTLNGAVAMYLAENDDDALKDADNANDAYQELVAKSVMQPGLSEDELSLINYDKDTMTFSVNPDATPAT